MARWSERDIGGVSILGDSDFESFSCSSDTPEAWGPVYYWFGQKYFECVLAQDVLSNCAPDEGISSADVRHFLPENGATL